MITCPNCGARFGNPRGQGWKGANRIKRLGWQRSEILHILQLQKCRDFESGLTSRQIGKEIRSIQALQGKRLSTDHGLGGRVSELQGLGLITSIDSVGLKDEDEQVWVTKRFTRYFLTEAGKYASIDPKSNPQLESETMTVRYQ